MTTPLTGGCLCGAIRYTVDAEIRELRACHCTNCQKASGAGGNVKAKLAYEDLLVPFVLSPEAFVPAGSYAFFRVGAAYHVSHTRLFQVNPRLEAGSFYDGWQATAELTPVWYISPHLELSGFYQFTRIRFPVRDQRLDVHLARLRIGTALNTKLSTNAFVQFNSTTHTVSANVRFRYNFREGTISGSSTTRARTPIGTGSRRRCRSPTRAPCWSSTPIPSTCDA